MTKREKLGYAMLFTPALIALGAMLLEIYRTNPLALMVMVGVVVWFCLSYWLVSGGGE